MYRNNERGMTAVEAIIAIALFALVATLVVGIFTRSLRISAREAVNLELEQSCHFLLKQIEFDLTHSGVSGISYLDDTDWHGVAMNLIEDVTSEGSLAWQGSQVLYFWDKGKLTVTKELNVVSADPLPNPVKFTPDEMLGLAAQTSTAKAEIGKRVTLFQVTNRRPDGSSRLVDLSIELERDLPNDDRRRFRLDSLVTVLN